MKADIVREKLVVRYYYEKEKVQRLICQYFDHKWRVWHDSDKGTLWVCIRCDSTYYVEKTHVMDWSRKRIDWKKKKFRICRNCDYYYQICSPDSKFVEIVFGNGCIIDPPKDVNGKIWPNTYWWHVCRSHTTRNEMDDENE
jgi:predicted nucleic-acid-binding Zn-ribbon protein